MRIVHIITSLERGGAQAVLYSLVTALAQRGYTQTIIYMHDGPYRAHFKQIGIPLYQLRGLVSPFDPVGWYRLYTLLIIFQPQLVHTVLWAANWMGRFMARLHHLPCVVALHNNYDQNGWQRHLLDGWISFKNTQLIAVSEQVKESFRIYHPPIYPIIVIPNGIEFPSLSHYSPLSRTSLQLQEDHFVIGTVARLDPIKRLPLLIEAIALLAPWYPSIRLILVVSGTPAQEQELRNAIKNWGIGSIVRWVINEEATPYYALFDCFVLTSAKEGISMALLAAMSYGVAPCITHSSRHHAVVQHMANGIVVCTDNATVFAQELAPLVNNATLRMQLANNAQQTIHDTWSIGPMIDAYEMLFKKLHRS
jgi:glycosyltransferase involved in cell wall biosynthesis